MKMEVLLQIMRSLRDPERGCPWDLEQDFSSIASHTLEEVYEVIDAIEQEDHPHLRDELGDLLFQVVFHARLAEELGLFDFNDVVTGIAQKLLSRHPHVFPDGTLESFGKPANVTMAQVEGSWERIKADERRQDYGAQASVLEDVPRALPALNRGRKLQKRAATVGFDWPEVGPVFDKVREELTELESALQARSDDAVEEELGDVLFSVVNLARHLGQDPEFALRRANEKFERRFRQVETLARSRGISMADENIETLESLWRETKQMEHPGD